MAGSGVRGAIAGTVVFLAALIAAMAGMMLVAPFGLTVPEAVVWPLAVGFGALVAALAGGCETRRMIEAAGIPVEVVSGGGTGTFDITSTIEGFDEVQAGSYVFMDAWYRKVEGPDTAFEPALFLWSTIVSRPAPDRAVGDIGLKTATPEHGLPTAFGIEGVETLSLSEEHVKLRVEGEARSLRPGDKIRFVPGHVCTTVNLHDCYVVVRGGIVEAVWPVAARGRAT